MESGEKDLRTSIIDAARAMLDEGADVGKITVRQIAERAGVGIGLINYHFKSKDNLLSIAIGNIMEQTMSKYTSEDSDQHIEPDQKLRMLLKELCASAGTDEKLVRFIMLREITEGHMNVPLILLPMLRDMFSEKDEMQLRIIALQILQPLQLAGLNPASFNMYSGIDISDPKQRDKYIDTLINNMIAVHGNGKGNRT